VSTIFILPPQRGNGDRLGLFRAKPPPETAQFYAGKRDAAEKVAIMQSSGLP
jgi:hypothetical protein